VSDRNRLGKPITVQEVMGLEHAPCRGCLGDDDAEEECPHCRSTGECPDRSGSCRCWVDAAYALACIGELWDD